MINTQTKPGGLKASVQSPLLSTGPSGSCLVGPALAGKGAIRGREAGEGVPGHRVGWGAGSDVPVVGGPVTGHGSPSEHLQACTGRFCSSLPQDLVLYLRSVKAGEGKGFV